VPDRRSSSPEVVVVGSAMVDLSTYVDRLPRAGETLFATGFSQGFGGKGANQAAAIAVHGVACAMVGCVGDDLFGAATIADLETFGVDTSQVATMRGEATGTAAILVEPSGENRIALGVGANRCVDGRFVEAALGALAARATRPPAVVVSQLERPQDAAVTAFEWARSVGATTVLTPAPPSDLSPRLLDACDWMVPNETELLALLDLAPDHPMEDALSRAATVAPDLGIGLAVTVGAAGAVLFAGGREERIQAPAVVVDDTTGAGDAFAGGFVASLARGLPAPVAARRAVAFASDSVTRRGTRASYRPFGELDSVGLSDG
jgi:ribokinase